MRNGLRALSLALLLLGPALADKVLSTYKPEQLKAAAGTGTTAVLTIDKPSVSQAHYALRGKIAFEGVKGGYLELLNTFPGKQVYFTRGLAATGPMSKLEGTSSGRDFELPFDATGPEGKVLHPERLQLNIVLPKGGKARILSLELVEAGGKP